MTVSTRLFCFVIALSVVTASQADPRTLRSSKFGGLSYVAVRDLATYYQLGKDLSHSPDRDEFRSSAGSLLVEHDSRNILVNSVTHWLNVPVLTARGQLWIASLDVLKDIDPVLRRGRSASKTPIRVIVLDPGHGGVDTGTRGKRAVEKTMTIDLAKRVERYLEAAGLKIYLTRTTDTTMSLDDRVELAGRRHADLFVSLHFNSGGSAQGIETYCVPPAGTPSTSNPFRRLFGHSNDDTCRGNRSDEQNAWLAHCVQRSLITSTGATDRGVRRARFVVIRDATCPAILVESGFLSNRSEEARILTSDYRDKLAKAIADGILDYKKSVE